MQEVVPQAGGKSRPDREDYRGNLQKVSPFFILGKRMWYVYIIYSEKADTFYTGVTDNLDWRLKRHNQGWGWYTKRGIP